jgi:hypothetical protein
MFGIGVPKKCPAAVEFYMPAVEAVVRDVQQAPRPPRPTSVKQLYSQDPRFPPAPPPTVHGGGGGNRRGRGRSGGPRAHGFVRSFVSVASCAGA